jgi:hypothetical protein
LPPALTSVKGAKPFALEGEHVSSRFSRNYSRERFGARANAGQAISLKETLMTVSTPYRIKAGAISVVFVAAAIAAACAGPATPIAPSASGTTFAVASVQPSTSSASIQQDLLLTKKCPLVDHCTVFTSSSGPIPVGSDIFYSGPLLDARTTSAIVVTTPRGDTAKGNCSFNYESLVGSCVVTGGTGALVGFHANVKVTSDFSTDPAGEFTWQGRYHFVR